MKANRLVTALALLLFSRFSVWSADSNTVALTDLATQVEALAAERYNPTGTLPFALAQLKQVWTNLSAQTTVSSNTAEQILAVWKTPVPVEPRNGPADLRNEAVTLTWQTFHCLWVESHPLSVEEQHRKAKQFQRLRTVLAALDNDLIEVNPNISRSTLEAVREKAQENIAELKKYMNSSAYPLLYYPLDDETFEIAEASIQSDVQNRVQHCATRSAENNTPPAVSPILRSNKAAKEADRRLAEIKRRQEGAILSVSAMGAIVRHYGLVARKVDVADRSLFPFWKLNGVGISFGDGVSMNLSLVENN